ncbi:lysozyme inhibitor LprI family protein [Pseudomonas akapageensis]|uniref:lysozyme inhibitor LprI family protein n=1 Tax=Pseudomonas akapageensis TaxID=2609961 RepID=UPI001FEA000F|nr:lysozyme inhibitor LprI family protein [Pseudomonas akapageensis]
MRRMMMIALAVLAFGAQAEEETTPCDNPQTLAQEDACVVYNKQTAESELSTSNKELLDRVKAQLAGHPDQINEISTRIKAAQGLWTKLRDADCAVETSQAKKGREFDNAQNTCIAQKSDERSEYLQSLFSDSDSGAE